MKSFGLYAFINSSIIIIIVLAMRSYIV